jgi:hypothetical protein
MNDVTETEGVEVKLTEESKEVWKWIFGNTPELKSSTIALSPVRFDATMRHVYSCHDRLRSWRMLSVIRSRAVAYARSGHPLNRCLPAAVADLAAALRLGCPATFTPQVG